MVLVARFAIRLSNLAFEAAEHGTLKLPWVYPETAQPTRRLVTGLLWVFALALAYPYLPGSETDAFKGVSVFVGLIISLGSSGIVNQVMSGLTLTYSRALHVGDFVKIGDHEGTVVHLGSLSTKLKTARREEVTIPNAVVVSHTTTNYSRHADGEGVFVPTSITIGYDVPWRQVHALMLLAAERTNGLRREPPPRVLQTALQDFYVQYTLLACLEHAHLRVPTLPRCTPTSRTRSTNTACRSCRPTTKPIPPIRRSCRARSGTRRPPPRRRRTATEIRGHDLTPAFAHECRRRLPTVALAKVGRPDCE